MSTAFEEYGGGHREHEQPWVNPR